MAKLNFFSLFPQPYPKILHSRSDLFGKMQVLEDQEERYLVFDSFAKQSSLSKKNLKGLALEYQKTMVLPILFDTPKKDILSIGLGAGCMPRLLHQLFAKAKFDIIEKREALVEIAQNFFYFPQHKNLQVIIGSGLHFLQTTPKNYDWILVDAFDSHGIPEEINQPLFFSLAKKKLRAGGILAVNYWSEDYRRNGAVIDGLIHEFADQFLFSDVRGCNNQIYFFLASNPATVKILPKEQIKKWDLEFDLNLERNLMRLTKINTNIPFARRSK